MYQNLNFQIFPLSYFLFGTEDGVGVGRSRGSGESYPFMTVIEEHVEKSL